MSSYIYCFLEWIDSLKVGDFYTYLTFIGIISLWSIFGFIATIAVSIVIQQANYRIFMFLCFFVEICRWN